jgi:energy-coupling factor transporter ATP-binding protein EcfA2
MRTDSHGHRGLKVRKGLGTSDDATADRLVDQLNALLGNEGWWSGDRRTDAEKQFEPVVVAAFFDGIESGAIDSRKLRDEKIPLPSRADGYSHVLFLGTTGAGKTTLLRHLIGCDHEQDRFPSTSTAKTTTADIEIVTAPGQFHAVTTFMPEHEVRAHIDECLEEACLEAVQTRAPSKIVNALLQHREQRFRLSYILGGWGASPGQDESEFQFDDEAPSFELDEDELVSPDDQKKNKDRLSQYLEVIVALVKEVEESTAKSLGILQEQKTADDRAAWLELFGSEALKNKKFSELALDILDDVSDRFEFILSGDIERGPNEWPVRWTLSESDRTRFLSSVRWFSSNDHRQFGRLLTPLVDGIRVRGPLLSSDLDGIDEAKLVLLDGEGIGHTATTASSISTRVTQRFEAIDMILLVDNAQQPMQAAPLALLRSVGSAGFATKLAIAFTHFDQVKGANLGSFDQKRNHVVASMRNAVASLRDSIGAGVAGALERQFDRKSIFLGGLDKATIKLPTGFKRELSKLFEMMERSKDRDGDIECVPIYEFKGLEIAMRDAIDAFRNPWRARLGIQYHDGVYKEHWTRIKALSRRLANGWGDEYDDLTPVADLLSLLQQEASKWLERPADWSSVPKDDEEREAALDRIRQAVFSRMFELVTRRLKDEQVANWRKAYDYIGSGSAARRASAIDGIHHNAAPHMSAAMTDDARLFLANLYAILQEAIAEAGGRIRPIAA